MKRTVALGLQDFRKIRENNYFYIDKTEFIRDWWIGGDAVTLITRPRRFGKTLLLNTVDRFLSNQYEDQGRLFEGLSIWKDEKFRKLQGNVPVIALSFADVKETTYEDAVDKLKELIFKLFLRFDYLCDSDALSEEEVALFKSYSADMKTSKISGCLNSLAALLYKHYGKKVVILLDEYDTPMQEAYVGDYWEEMTALMRSFFNSTFKTNPYMDRALMTGITRVSRESMFSDMNNLKIASVMTDMYTDAFGFTEEEVFAAMDEAGLTNKAGVKAYYDGFTFGSTTDIYNPWSVLNFLQEGMLKPYWANTSSNKLASKLIREGSPQLKKDFSVLIEGGTISSPIDEQIVFGEISAKADSVWSLLLASGYLKTLYVAPKGESRPPETYDLVLTNEEVRLAFRSLVTRWFDDVHYAYNAFIDALLADDLDAMNTYMNDVSASVFSSFDTGRNPSRAEPERFYHGFVLGLMVELRGRYVITSNRESGFGRYDVMLSPRDTAKDPGIIIEFKVRNPRREATLEDAVQSALTQIRERNYAQSLTDQGVPAGHIHSYGFAFEGKEVLIDGEEASVEVQG